MNNVIHIDSKKCCNCQLVKSINLFHNSKNRKDGKVGYCISCTKIYDSKRRVEKASKIEGFFQTTVNQIRARAKKKHLNFNITIDDLLEKYVAQQGLCAITKIKLDHFKGNGRPPNRLSVDRIDNTKGYIKNNIQLICDCVNTMKGTLSMKELEEYCKLILLNSKQ